MKWIAKAFLQKTVSFLPKSSEINYFIQKNISKTFPVSSKTFLDSAEHAFEHLKRITPFEKNIKGLKIFEFGGGWHITGPLIYAAIGIKNQTIIDIQPNIKSELIQTTVTWIKNNKSLLNNRYGFCLAKDFLAIDSTLPVDIVSLGINYKAPLDAGNTLLEANHYDLVVNTNTLEHIPYDRIEKILSECFRILKPGGFFSCIIDLIDHFSYFDASIGVYNFLKFSEKQWNALFNSSLNYQNRLRACDYTDVFEKSGFDIIMINESRPEDSMNLLSGLKINDKFNNKCIDSIAVTRLDALLQKPCFKNL